MIKKILTLTITLLIFTLWPVNLYFKNILPDFLIYIIPAILLTISYFLYSTHSKYYLIPILIIGLFEKKLAILPLLFCIFDALLSYKKEVFSYLVISLAIFFWQFAPWRGQTVFNRDYEGEQGLIRNIHLYPDIPMARFFQNKPKLYLEKVSSNFFTLIDLNNYFFAGHPSPTTISTQELYKYYWPLIIFLVLGIYNIKDLKNYNFAVISIIACILSLSFLKNFDRNDFILWFPIGLIIRNGIKKIF